ncbi:50S ribosomal protein L32 [Massilia mucilaginosa]|uniref:50S ribosomal protein L32 n=1 Tax=Massilia mucilaginosa TaxID=2609282 RepID=UPI003F8983DE
MLEIAKKRETPTKNHSRNYHKHCQASTTHAACANDGLASMPHMQNIPLSW